MNINDLKQLNDSGEEYEVTILELIIKETQKSYWQVRIIHNSNTYFLLTMRNTIKEFKSLDFVFSLIQKSCFNSSKTLLIFDNQQIFKVSKLL